MKFVIKIFLKKSAAHVLLEN